MKTYLLEIDGKEYEFVQNPYGYYSTTSEGEFIKLTIFELEALGAREKKEEEIKMPEKSDIGWFVDHIGAREDVYHPKCPDCGKELIEKKIEKKEEEIEMPLGQVIGWVTGTEAGVAYGDSFYNWMKAVTERLNKQIMKGEE